MRFVHLLSVVGWVVACSSTTNNHNSGDDAGSGGSAGAAGASAGGASTGGGSGDASVGGTNPGGGSGGAGAVGGSGGAGAVGGSGGAGAVGGGGSGAVGGSGGSGAVGGSGGGSSCDANHFTSSGGKVKYCVPASYTCATFILNCSPAQIVKGDNSGTDCPGGGQWYEATTGCGPTEVQVNAGTAAGQLCGNTSKLASCPVTN